MRLGKPKAKAGGLGVKKMTTKADDSLFDQAPAVAAAPPTPPSAKVPLPSHLFLIILPTYNIHISSVNVSLHSQVG